MRCLIGKNYFEIELQVCLMCFHDHLMVLFFVDPVVLLIRQYVLIAESCTLMNVLFEFVDVIIVLYTNNVLIVKFLDMINSGQIVQ